MNMNKMSIVGLTVLTVSALPFGIAFADSGDTTTTLHSDATVGFTPNNQDNHLPLNPVTPFDDKGNQKNVTPSDGKQNPNSTAGNQLTLDYVPSFRFGTNNQISSAKTHNLFASALSLQDGSIVPNYAQVTDLRDSTTDGWNLQVKQDDEWTSADNKDTIAGAKINVSNGQVTRGQLTEFTAPTMNTDVSISKDGGAVNIMTAAKSDNNQDRVGYGSWLYVMGNDSTKDKSVQLDIPDKTILSAKTYTTHLTWTLGNTANVGN